MEKKKDTDTIEAITDTAIAEAIRARLNDNPDYYLLFLKKLVDEIEGDISDDIMFEFLKPAFSQESPTLEDIFSGRNTSSEIDDSLVVSPESVDMFFYPHVRKKLKQWQQTFFDEASTESEKLKAEENLQKVFKRLTWEGQGKRKKNVVTAEQKRGIRKWFRFYDNKSKEVFKNSKRNSNNRSRRIKESFNNIGAQVLKQNLSISSPERLRDALLSVKNNCSIRAVKECIVEFNLIKCNKLLSDKKTKTLTIRGTGSKAKINRHVEP